jgi:transposase
MCVIGIDTHKSTLAACAIDELGSATSERTFANDPAGHAALAAWAAELVRGGVIGVEGSSSFGAPVARFLASRSFSVREVPPQLSRRERVRTRRAGKSDPGDALAIARVTACEADLPPVRLADRTADIALLVEARDEVVTEMTRCPQPAARRSARAPARLRDYGGEPRGD